MPLSNVCSLALLGLESIPVEVEVDAYFKNQDMQERSQLVIVGLPDAAIKEAKDRVLTAIKYTGLLKNPFTGTVNLAPGDLKKEGVIYDLPIAVGVLHSLGIIPQSANLAQCVIAGELALSGEIRPIRGALAMAMMAKSLKKMTVFLPLSNAYEAAMVEGIEIIGVKDLKEVILLLQGKLTKSPLKIDLAHSIFKEQVPEVNFSDIKGHFIAKRALEIVAAGGHNILLCGPPGSGKTMLAKALRGIMPDLTVDEALETTKIHSIAGLLKKNEYLKKARPFRAPHHTVSYAGLIGGGQIPRPGEVSLAHNGILFLDEFPEFSKTVLEVMRQPMEDKKVTISRSQGHFIFPTNFICIAAMNPCPCGFLGHPDKACKDSSGQIQRYQGKISGPLLDRFDLRIDVPWQNFVHFIDDPNSESSETIKKRVTQARLLQHKRLGSFRTNALMSARELKQHASLCKEGMLILKQAVDVLGISTRGCDRLLKVSLTIADLSHCPSIEPKHLMEALSLRQT